MDGWIRVLLKYPMSVYGTRATLLSCVLGTEATSIVI